VNNNGQQDPGELAIKGVDVVITDSTGNTFTLTMDATGMYMAEVPIGDSVIDINKSTLPSGYEQTVGTDPKTVIVSSGSTATNLDGYFFPSAAPSSLPSESPSEAPTSSPTTFPSALPLTLPSSLPGALPTVAAKLKGIVFEDKNSDGSQYPDEVDIAGVIL
jgi:hypothetical protein